MSAFEFGTTFKFSHRLKPDNSAPITNTGTDKRTRLNPATRKLVISWFDDSFRNTRSTAERNPHGIVYISDKGSTLITKRNTNSGGAP